MKNSPRLAIATFTQTHKYLGTDIISLCQEHIHEAPHSDWLDTVVEFDVAKPGTCCTRCQDIKAAYDLHIKTKYGR